MDLTARLRLLGMQSKRHTETFLRDKIDAIVHLCPQEDGQCLSEASHRAKYEMQVPMHMLLG